MKQKKAAFLLRALKEKLACFIAHAGQGPISPYSTAVKSAIPSDDAVFLLSIQIGGTRTARHALAHPRGWETPAIFILPRHTTVKSQNKQAKPALERNEGDIHPGKRATLFDRYLSRETRLWASSMASSQFKPSPAPKAGGRCRLRGLWLGRLNSRPGRSQSAGAKNRSFGASSR